MKKKLVKPDDYFSSGLFEFARFGKNVVMRSNATAEQLDVIHGLLLEKLPNIEKKIESLVKTAVDLINEHEPTILLHRAYWEMASHHTAMITDDSHTPVDTEAEDALTSVRALEYIQNVVASTPANKIQKDKVDEEQWTRLIETISNLYKTFNTEYLLAYSIKSRSEDSLEEEVAQFRIQSVAHWVNVRGERYSNHEKEHLEDLLLCQNELIEDVLGVSARTLVDEIFKIHDSLTNGVGESAIETGELSNIVYTEFERRIESGKLKPNSEQEIQSELLNIVDDLGLSERHEKAIGRFLGFDLFDLQKVTNLPQNVLEKLSWGRGEETTFFSGDKFSGWPIRIAPISRRPFVSIDGKFYCFCIYGLFDNFYRVIQRLLFAGRPDRKQEWTVKQKENTEDLPFRFFEKLLPGNFSLKEVYYKWYPNENSDKLEWCETDGIIIYGDNLIVVEVKGGSFTYTSPFDDFQAHIKSIEALVKNPSKQGERFVEYLANSDEVSLYDVNKSEVFRIRKDSFRRITICALTADPFTEIASQIQHLKPLGVELGSTFTWSISIDDLRVCKDVFSNPLIFLHYLEKRMDATRSLKVNVNDELDHLGLYFEHNDYSMHAEELASDIGGDLRFNGYRQKIDEHFQNKIYGLDLAELGQKDLPENIKSILEYCSKNSPQKWVDLTSYLLNGDSTFREQISNGIEQALEAQIARRRLQVISTTGERRLTIACWQPTVFSPNPDFLLEQVKTEMTAHEEPDRKALQLFFDARGSISDIKWSEVVDSDIPVSMTGYYQTKALEMKRRRIIQSKEKYGKVRPNSKCPCGSGRKFKKCCRNNT
jgi:hypothetical protein